MDHYVKKSMVRDVIQTLTCRGEITVVTEAIIIVKDWITMLRRTDWITLLTTEFDSIAHHDKNDRRGACQHKAVVVRRTAT